MTRPTIILIHGGFWRARYDRSLMAPLARDLAGRGWNVANIEYRGLGNGGGWPATFDDVLAAIDGALAGTGAGAVAIGHSAGGQLALWAAAERPLAGVVAQAAVSDLHEAHRRDMSRGAVDEFLGGSPDEVPERYAAASPACRLPLHAPQLLVHGDADEDVPVELSRDYAAAATRAGDPVTYVELRGDGHYEHLDPATTAWRTVIDWLGDRW